MLLLIVVIVLGLLYAPQFWVKKVIEKWHNNEIKTTGTGGELAEHLLKNLNITDIEITSGKRADHYDPLKKQLYLNDKTYNNKTLSAITIATHEIGHVIQDFNQEKLLKWRTKLARMSVYVQSVGQVLFLISPILVLLKVPLSAFGVFLFGLACNFSNIILHFLTIPVEIDASFNKALPILINGNYVEKKNIPAAKQILTAASLTYFSVALASLLNIWHWVRLLRR